METAPSTPPAFEARLLPIDQLVPAPYNPRRRLKPTDKAYRKLEASLREFGLVEPLVWNERTGHVVGGHARLAILTLMGLAEVPVSVVNLTDAREKALNVILNNQEAQGRYDPAKLADLLLDLEGLPELVQTGFDATMLPALKLEALRGPVADDPTGRVTVALVMPAEKYEEVAPKLDALVTEFDLVSHVTRG